ncbi:sulfite exporter TauE/SafE family protein [Flavobacteriales bacterium]|nr:sulfite exporter TauE/SafE family protein [Flavobacteriales bacterium]
MYIIGLFLALIVGVSLGLIGSGGSILTAPILIYIFEFNEKVATAYSLFIVGFSSLLGSIKNSKKKIINWKIVAVFGIPSFLGVWLVRYFLIPILPETIYVTSNFDISRRFLILGLFSILMMLASYSMISKNEKVIEIKLDKLKYLFIPLEGLIIGGFTGLVGAGGGFLIIPALILLTNISFKKAIATSLMIIAIKSLIGFFLGDAMYLKIDWSFLIVFSAITSFGVYLGTYMNYFFEGKLLKKGFGYFVFFMACLILIKELLIK